MVSASYDACMRVLQLALMAPPVHFEGEGLGCQYTTSCLNISTALVVVLPLQLH